MVVGVVDLDAVVADVVGGVAGVGLLEGAFEAGLEVELDGLLVVEADVAPLQELLRCRARRTDGWPWMSSYIFGWVKAGSSDSLWP